MARSQGVTAVTAGSTNANVLSGELVEFTERPSRVRLFLCGDAAGELRGEFRIGSRTVLAESPMSRAARVPIKPDDLVLEEIAMPGERLTLKLRNTGAGSNNAFWAVEVDPVA